MKTIIASILALVLASPVQAEDWTLLGKDSTTYLYDRDSFTVSGDLKVLSVSLMQITEKGEVNTAASGIFIAECLEKRSGTVGIYTNNVSKEYQWNPEGKKVYDYAGVVLCLEVLKTKGILDSSGPIPGASINLFSFGSKNPVAPPKSLGIAM